MAPFLGAADQLHAMKISHLISKSSVHGIDCRELPFVFCQFIPYQLKIWSMSSSISFTSCSLHLKVVTFLAGHCRSDQGVSKVWLD